MPTIHLCYFMEQFSFAAVFSPTCDMQGIYVTVVTPVEPEIKFNHLNYYDDTVISRYTYGYSKGLYIKGQRCSLNLNCWGYEAFLKI